MKLEYNILGCATCAFNLIYMDLKSPNGEVLAIWHPLFLYQQHYMMIHAPFFAAASAQIVIDNN